MPKERNKRKSQANNSGASEPIVTLAHIHGQSKQVYELCASKAFKLFCWWCWVSCIVLLTLCIFYEPAMTHNKIALCGMITAFELN